MLKIIIGLATRSDDIVPTVVDFCLRNQAAHGTQFVWRACRWSAPLAQETLFQAVAEINPDYLLMIDSDVILPLNALDILLKCNKDMISAPIWHYDPHFGDIHLNVTKQLGVRMLDNEKDGIEEICSTSFGCLLIKGYVLKKFKDLKESFTQWSPLIDTTSQLNSSDVIFFKKTGAMGFNLWVCWDVKGTEHYTKIHLGDRVLKRKYENKLDTTNT